MYNGKNRCYLAQVCQLWTCCDLENSVKSPKVTDLISIHIVLYLYSCSYGYSHHIGLADIAHACTISTLFA